VESPGEGAATLQDVTHGLTRFALNQGIHWLANVFVVIDAHRESNTNFLLAQREKKPNRAMRGLKLFLRVERKEKPK
jgi:hypothetical protein